MVSTTTSVCANCGNQVKGKFCTNCGQKDKDFKPSLKEWVSAVWDDFISVDAKFVNTLKALLSPGQLTTDWLAGRQMRFVHPVRLYVFLSLIYALYVFLFNSQGNFIEGFLDGFLHLSESGLQNYSSQIVQLVSFFILPFSVLTTLIFSRKEKLVVGAYFVMNVFSFITLIYLFLEIITRVFAAINIPIFNYLAGLALLYTLIFVGLSAKKVYQIGYLATTIKMIIWTLVNLVLLILIAQIAFGFFQAHEQQHALNLL